VEKASYEREKTKMGIVIERLPPDYMEKALILLRDVFACEQNIPVELHDIKEDLNPLWWCAKDGLEIVGTAAGWIEGGNWHWGRFAVDRRLRGLGIGKKLAVFSFKEIFGLGAGEIHIEARDVTVGIIRKFGGEVTGEPVDFYGAPVTPMILKKHEFLEYLRRNTQLSSA
jgi:predicted GNAT family N-acyltransferase